jgi:DNA repair ATPase RecN
MSFSGNGVFHRLKSVSVIGGFLNSQQFDLSHGLNCIIGARGTGKTTILELVRYTMGAMPTDRADWKRIESLVDQNLSGGRVEVAVDTKDGFSYVISRSIGEDPVVLTSDGAATDINMNAGGLFRINVFSQNEVESIADRANSQLDIIDNFEAESLQGVEQEIRTVKVDLESNASKIIPLRRKIDTIHDELQVKPSLDEKLKAFSQESGQNAEIINAAHGQKALRDRESRAIQSGRELLGQTHQALYALLGKISQRSDSIFTEEMLRGPNGQAIKTIHSLVAECGQQVDTFINQAMESLCRAVEGIDSEHSKLDLVHKQQEMQFRELIEKHKEAQSKATERSRLEKMRNELLQKEQEHKQLLEQLNQLRQERQKRLERLSELRDERFRIRQTIVKRINEALSPSICVEIMQFGNPEQYRNLLVEKLSGNSMKQGVVAGKIVNTFGPIELSDVVKQKNKQALTDKAELNADQAEKVIAALSDAEILFELEMVELVDLPTIQLNDGGVYKASSLLSTGQKCTAILPILLMDSENPLLIDQPEDNLDNRFVYETIVDSISKVKKKRQLLFVTHNPNIPVLAEADKVLVLESDGTNAKLVNEGTVDHCKDNIVTLLEGGEDAFNRRRKRYAY